MHCVLGNTEKDKEHKSDVWNEKIEVKNLYKEILENKNKYSQKEDPNALVTQCGHRETGTLAAAVIPKKSCNEEQTAWMFHPK